MDERWLIDETRPLTELEVEDLEWKLADSGPGVRGARTPTLALCVHDITIRDNRKWFGDADVRVDALVVTGHGDGTDPGSFYRPRTARFARVADGARLPINEGGLLVFHGPAAHFLDFQLTVSRDRKDTDDLAALLATRLRAEDTESAVGGLLGLAGAVPPVMAVTAAIAAAATLGDLAYRALRAATGATIGVYRGSHLEHRDGFGIGAHPAPPKREYVVNDLAFRYEIVLEE